MRVVTRAAIEGLRNYERVCMCHNVVLRTIVKSDERYTKEYVIQCSQS